MGFAMLSAMRKNSSSWTVRILLGIMIVSFAVWGIGDVFLGAGNSATVAEVGDLEVDVNDVNRAFEARYQQFNRQLGGAIDRQGAMAFGLLDQAVQNEIAQRLVDMHGLELGIGVADSEIRDTIQNNPAFRGAGGFDRTSLEFYLRSQGLTEVQLIDNIREEIRRRAILQAITSITPVSKTLQDTLNEYRNEQRLGTAMIIDASAIEVAEPEDSVLVTYLSENQDQYQSPEYRTGAAIRLEPADLVDEIAVDETELREVYDLRIDQYTTPEERKLGQLLAPDGAVAQEVKEALAEAEDFASLAEQFKDKGVSYSAIGPVRQADLPEGLAQAAFALEAGAISEPVASDFGHHIFNVIEIEEGSQVPFEEVRDELSHELALDLATQQLPDLAAKLDDEIAAGESLEAAAETLQLNLLNIPATGRDGQRKDSGGAEDDGPGYEVLGAMFGAEVDETSLLEETSSGGYFVYRVDSIEEARPLAIEEARTNVLNDWLEAERQTAARALATNLLGQIQEGRALDALAEEHGEVVSIKDIQPLLRSDSGAMSGISREAVAALFDTEEGKFASEPVAVGNGFALIRNDEIIAAAKEGDAIVDAEEIAVARRNDILSEYEQSLRVRYPISVNQRALEVFYQEPN